MTTKEYDSIVIGSGPAGEGASMKLAKCGHHVAMIEHYREEIDHGDVMATLVQFH